ncbi:MAG: hypothetical protein LBG87_04785, partial [Spirochaetaceae bacterium]|nr:hypothetical protein [Spirochaetaceae bacterium]
MSDAQSPDCFHTRYFDPKARGRASGLLSRYLPFQYFSCIITEEDIMARKKIATFREMRAILKETEAILQNMAKRQEVAEAELKAFRAEAERQAAERKAEAEKQQSEQKAETERLRQE